MFALSHEHYFHLDLQSTIPAILARAIPFPTVDKSVGEGFAVLRFMGTIDLSHQHRAATALALHLLF